MYKGEWKDNKYSGLGVLYGNDDTLGYTLKYAGTFDQGNYKLGVVNDATKQTGSFDTKGNLNCGIQFRTPNAKDVKREPVASNSGAALRHSIFEITVSGKNGGSLKKFVHGKYKCYYEGKWEITINDKLAFINEDKQYIIYYNNETNWLLTDLTDIDTTKWTNKNNLTHLILGGNLFTGPIKHHDSQAWVKTDNIEIKNTQTITTVDNATIIGTCHYFDKAKSAIKSAKDAKAKAAEAEQKAKKIEGGLIRPRAIKGGHTLRAKHTLKGGRAVRGKVPAARHGRAQPQGGILGPLPRRSVGRAPREQALCLSNKKRFSPLPAKKKKKLNARFFFLLVINKKILWKPSPAVRRKS